MYTTGISRGHIAPHEGYKFVAMKIRCTYSGRKQNVMPDVITMHGIELSRVIDKVIYCLSILIFLFIYLNFFTYSYIYIYIFLRVYIRRGHEHKYRPKYYQLKGVFCMQGLRQRKGFFVFTFSSWMRRYWFYVKNDFRNFHQIFTF